MLASIGIVCLDEFDKIASGQNNAIFAGAGTTKDVTGMGVQRELLKMLEASEVVVPLDLTHSSYADHVVMSTADIAFIAAGAFSGFQQIAHRRAMRDSIGFGREQATATAAIPTPSRSTSPPTRSRTSPTSRPTASCPSWSRASPASCRSSRSTPRRSRTSCAATSSRA